MEQFSRIELSFKDFEKEVELKKLSLGINLTNFSGKDATKEASAKRRERSDNDYWYFDKTYFPPELYEDYGEPNVMLEKIVDVCRKAGIHIFIGPRGHGKTIEGKKLLIWLLVTGKIHVSGVYSEIILKASWLLLNIYLLMKENVRLRYDYKFEFVTANADAIRIKMLDGQQRPLRVCAAFSEGRSVKGFTELFGRPEFLLGDDIETLESSFTSGAVQLRMQKIQEAYHSLGNSGVFLILANDFNPASCIHQIRYEHENNLLPEHWHVYAYKAWSNIKTKLQPKGALWFKRFKATTEAALKKMLKPKDESDWQTGFQQNPTPPEGDFFKRSDYDEYVSLPHDVRGIIYCDPNLSKKGKGNTTAIPALLYSPSTNEYYIPMAVCRSFADSNKLLASIFTLKEYVTTEAKRSCIAGLAFDGNVTQESTWTQHIRNFCKITSQPFPHVEYKKYKVNDLAKNFQSAYAEGKVKFAPGFSKTVDGERFLVQFFSFSGVKKEGNDDDAPDSMICAFEFIHERKLIRQKQQPVKVIKDYYQL